jgi:PGF-CTERM protein
MRIRASLLAVLLVVSLGTVAAPAAAATQNAQGEAYSGTHVEFETTSNAISGYAVDDAVVISEARMQSASEARSQAGIGVDVGIEAVGSVVGAELASRTEAGASVTVGFESGGQMQSNDNERGVVQFQASDGEQFVQVDVSSDAEAESESDERVVVEKGDTEGTFIVVGEGEVDVNEDGQVNAELQEGSELVYRQYDGERSENDKESERMIQAGTATAEVYVQEAAEDGEQAGAATVNVVEYGQDTAVEVRSQSRDRVEMTVERTESEGKVVLTSVSESAFDTAGGIEVFVDGEAAVRADSYSAVEQSATEGDEPRYYVAQSSSAEATTDVAIGIDHFSERTVELRSAQDGTQTPTVVDDSGAGGDDSTSDGDGAGFGVVVALVALGSTLLAARRY